MSTDHGNHNIRAIRQLMLVAFTPQALRRFCQDRTFLHPVLKEFAPEQGLNTMVDRVIDFCEAQYLWDTLLPEVRHDYPRQYARFQSELGAPDMVYAERPCPYRGLEPFEAEHAEFYFGREAMVERLVDKVKNHAFVAVVGPSGCGKSSLARAGLVTALHGGALPGSEDWAIRIFRPGADPLRSLAVPLVDLLEPEATEVTRLREVRELASAFYEGTVPMADVAARLRQAHPEIPQLLLIADQFEELYTECPDGGHRRAFVSGLLAAAEAGNVRILLTLRADFYGRVLARRGLGAAVDAGLVNVLPMSEEELRAAVERPALETGRFLEPGLVERIAEDVAGEPGNLPLLQYALTELWACQTPDGKLTHQAYEIIGKVDGAITRRAEAVYEELAKQGQAETVHRVFLRLTHYGSGAEGTRRRAMVDDLVTPRTPREEVEPVVRALADARLLVTGREQPAPDVLDPAATAEVSHEALIRGWDRLRRWLDEDQSFGLWRERLASALRIWVQMGHHESALLHGASLAEAEGWIAERGDDMNEAERAYIEASLAFRKREAAMQERRRRWMVAIAAGAAVVFFLLAALAGIQWRAAEKSEATAVALAGSEAAARAIAEAERDRADKQARVAISRKLAAQALTLADDQLDLALLLSLEGYHIAESVDEPDLAQDLRRTLYEMLTVNPRLSAYLYGHNSMVASVAVSPDGKTIASGDGDGIILLWDAARGQVLGEPLTRHSQLVRSLAFSPDGRRLASGSEDHTIILWDVENREPLHQLNNHTDEVRSVAFAPDGLVLASGGGDKTVRLWDTETGQQLGEALTDHTGLVGSVAFSPDGKTLASGDDASNILLWKMENDRAELHRRIEDHDSWIQSLAFSPDGLTLASGSGDDTIRLWDVATGEPRSEPLLGHDGDVRSLAFSSDGRILASGGSDTVIVLWDTETFKPIGDALVGHTATVRSIAFVPTASEGVTLVSGGEDTAIIQWDPTAGQRLGAPLLHHSAPVRSVAFSPDGTKVAVGTADDDPGVMLWDIGTGQPIGHRLDGLHERRVWALAFSPDGETLVSGSIDGSIVLWDVATRRALVRMPNQGSLHSLAFDSTGRTLASGHRDGRIVLWNVDTGAPRVQLQKHWSFVMSIAFSPDGRWLASGSWDRTVRLWDVETLQSWELHHPRLDLVDAVAFSPDGKILAAGGYAGSLIFWDVDTHQPLAEPLIGHDTAVNSLAFSPDGQLLASGSDDESIILWDVATRRPLARLPGHQEIVWSVAFSPDGTMLASGSADQSVIVWHVDFDSLKTRACRLVHRNLTLKEWRSYVPEEAYHKTCEQWPAAE